jgi:hypothetical protein
MTETERLLARAIIKTWHNPFAGDVCVFCGSRLTYDDNYQLQENHAPKCIVLLARRLLRQTTANKGDNDMTVSTYDGDFGSNIATYIFGMYSSHEEAQRETGMTLDEFKLKVVEVVNELDLSESLDWNIAAHHVCEYLDLD